MALVEKETKKKYKCYFKTPPVKANNCGDFLKERRVTK